jgi:pimeloyl-ACP methyl ester carboxylesterase
MNSFPPKQIVEVQGKKIQYVTSGKGTPAIILVNGGGGPIEGWYRVYTELEQMSTVVAYNRSGIGGSDRPTTPQTGAVIVSMLRALLHEIKIAPPYVLVGHSLGGLYVNLFARQFPHEIAAVVFLDAAAPGDEVLQQEPQTPLQKLFNLLMAPLNLIFRKDPNDEVAFVPDTVEQIRNAVPFPAIPVTVVSGGNQSLPPKVQQIRHENQKTLSAISPHGKQIIAAKSGHFPQFTEPEFVVQVIRDVFEQVQGV